MIIILKKAAEDHLSNSNGKKEITQYGSLSMLIITLL